MSIWYVWLASPPGSASTDMETTHTDR